MTNLTTKSSKISRDPISPQNIALIRLVNDFLIVLITAFSVFPILDQTSARIILATTIGVFSATLIGFLLVRSGKTIYGMGFVIYGLIIGLPVISIFIEQLGLFTLVTILLITTLSVTYGIPFRRIIEAMTAAFVMGTASLIFDLNFRGAPFRLTAGPELTILFWAVILALALVFIYLIARQFAYFSLRTKLIASFAAVTLLSLTVLGLINNARIEDILTEEANQSLFNAAAQTEDSLRQFIDFNFRSIETEAKLPNFLDYLTSSDEDRAALAPQVAETLAALVGKDMQNLSSYALLDLDGNVLMDTVEHHIGQSEATLTAFTDPLEQAGPAMSQVIIDPFTNQPSLYFSTPVFNLQDDAVGILRIRYHADILQNLIKNNNDRAGVNSFAVLFDENLVHLAHGTNPAIIYSPLDFDTYQRLMAEGRLPERSAEETFLNLQGLKENLEEVQSSDQFERYFEAQDITTGSLVNQVVVIDMEEPPWLLAFFQPQEIYLAPIEQLTNNTTLLSLVSVIGAAAIAFALTQVISAPILSLTKTADQLSKGDFTARVEVTTEDEIGNLGKTINTMAGQLQNLVNNLEKQVANRTRDLENRAAQLQASAEVARDVTSEQQIDDLLNRAATLIQDRFGYYHVGIYLTDSKSEHAFLAASNDTPGRRLLEVEHRYRIDTDSNVGYTLLSGKAMLASAEDPNLQPNYHPLLQNSMAQMILPLRHGNQTIGAIDIHSTNPMAFSEEDKQIFQILADQIAIAIQKAKFQQDIQETLNELEAAYSVFTKEAWQGFLQSRRNIAGFRYNQRQVEAIYTSPENVEKAWLEGQKVIETKASPDDPRERHAAIAIPLKVRGEVIGVLNVDFETDNVPAGTSNLINEIADRLSLIIENARLIETAQRTAEREQLTSHISNRIRQSLDMDMILRTAAQEIGESLGLAEVELRLGRTSPETSSRQTSGNGKSKSETS